MATTPNKKSSIREAKYLTQVEEEKRTLKLITSGDTSRPVMEEMSSVSSGIHPPLRETHHRKVRFFPPDDED